MLPAVTVWGFTVDLALVLLLLYLGVLWLGGWILELLGKAHFHRAARYAHTGFAYDAELDRYECPQGELLTLHTFDDRNKLAIYKAPASSCNECVLKAFCAPHDTGRHVYRSLAEFHETDVGRFYRWLSLVILAVALVFSAGGMLAWWNKPGQWMLVAATVVSLAVFLLEASSRPEKAGIDTEPFADAVTGTSHFPARGDAGVVASGRDADPVSVSVPMVTGGRPADPILNNRRKRR